MTPVADTVGHGVGEAAVGAPWRARRVTVAGTWDRERIVDAIRRWHAETGSPPRSYEWAPATGRALGLTGTAETRWEREHPSWPEVSTVRAHLESWRSALIAAGFPAPPPLHGTVAERAEAARRLAAARESMPSIADHLGVHVNTVRKYLNATRCDRCAGPKITAAARTCISCLLAARNEPVFTRDEVIEALRAWTREAGRRPTSHEWTDSKGGSDKWRDEWPRWPSARQVCRLFRTWNAAVLAAGLVPSRTRPSDADVLAAIRRETARLGRPPTSAEWRAATRSPSVRAISRRFGGWRAALIAAGVRQATREPTRPEILRALRRFSMEHSAAPTVRAWRRWPATTMSVNAITVAFGSWDAALQAAGLKEPVRPADEITALRSFAHQHGRAPTAREWTRTRQRPSASAIVRHHGSWNRALQAADLLPRRRANWDRTAIIEAIRAFADRHGRPPTRDEWLQSDGSHPVATTVVSHFGTWTAALDTARATLAPADCMRPFR